MESAQLLHAELWRTLMCVHAAQQVYGLVRLSMHTLYACMLYGACQTTAGFFPGSVVAAVLSWYTAKLGFKVCNWSWVCTYVCATCASCYCTCTEFCTRSVGWQAAAVQVLVKGTAVWRVVLH
jgi:hypothetical protein